MALQYSFVSEPDDNLKCCICLEVATDPKQEEECGKLFCNDCLEEYELKTKGSLSCPHCRTQVPRYFNDKKSEYKM